jgi:O-antigen ligase
MSFAAAHTLVSKDDHRFESLALTVIFAVSWLGFGNIMAAAVLLAFIFALFFRGKRTVIFRDKPVLVMAAAFSLNSIISSLLSIDRVDSALLSALWFLVIFVPFSYAGFGVSRENETYERLIAPVTFGISCIIMLWVYGAFIANTAANGLEFKRYTFVFLGEASTPDFLVMTGAIGYGWLRQKEGRRFRWYGLLFLVAGMGAMALTYDRGGMMSLFIVSVVLLAFDYKRLAVYLVVAAAGVTLALQLEAFSGIRRIFEYLYSAEVQTELRESMQISTFRQAWLMIKDHWLMGVGTNNYSTFAENYGTGRGWSYAHNVVLQFWAENGLLGMLLGMSIIGLSLYRWGSAVKHFRSRYIALGTGAAFMGMVIGNLTNSTIWIIRIALPFWLLAGVLGSMHSTAGNTAADDGQ